MLKEVIEFTKNPVYQEDKNSNLKYRLFVFFQLLVWAMVLSFFFGILIGSIESVWNLDLGKHAIDEFMAMYSPFVLFGAAVLLAPVLEELFFRGPLVFFKESRHFKYIYYTSILMFGFYHITNFELTKTTLLIAPLLVAPQLSVGVFLGYIRVRFGLLWAMALHAGYNLIFIGPVVVLQLLNIPLE
jgi:membrane protease YdiL (CAAX protease family)